MANGGYAPTNGLEPYYEVRGEGAGSLPAERPGEATAAVRALLNVWSRP